MVLLICQSISLAVNPSTMPMYHSKKLNAPLLTQQHKRRLTVANLDF